jgi:hypothetical protein
LKDQLEAHGFHKLPQAVKPWIPGFGELAKPAMDLGHVTDRDQEISVVPLFETGVQITGGVCGVLETAKKIVMVADGRLHFRVLLI